MTLMPIFSVNSSPEARKLMRDMQKMGMSVIYGDLIKGLKLKPEPTEQFKDLLADHIMDGIDVITQVLHDKSSNTEIDRLLSGQDQTLRDKVLALVGPEGLAQYLDYTKHLTSTLTAAEFEKNFIGDKAAKAEKKKQFTQAMQEETQST